MRIKLAYGRSGLWVDLPDHNLSIIEPKYVPGLPDALTSMQDALRNPLGAPPLQELVSRDDTVAVVFSDITRPQPREKMLTVLLEEIAHVPRDQIVLINALGTHRPNKEEELVEMLGEKIAKGYHIVQHDAFDLDSLSFVGRTSFGHEVHINTEYMRANKKILTGFIEPHFFAGVSGGPKAVLPGIADQRSVLTNHEAKMIADPRATWGVTEGNPIWEEIREIALKTSPTFLFNVTLNRDKQITKVFAGDLLEAHTAGTQFVRSSAMVPVTSRFDIVVTTNSGYPLDLNLYQSVKGMSAAAQVVKEGGSIVIAAECWDGLPDHGEYANLLRMVNSPDALLEMVQAPGFLRQDQWQVQIQAQILKKADVYVRSDYLDDEHIERALLKPCHTIEDTVSQLLDHYGPEASICVLPEGPMTIPHIT
ncbi:MAG: nickel-dependent lactate racemase [Anaerolineales bacterium]|jgi:nickel-dependent lactate racemase